MHKWMGLGAKLSLARTTDADVLKEIVLKLHKRVTAGAATLLVKVKSHRGDPREITLDSPYQELYTNGKKSPTQ